MSLLARLRMAVLRVPDCRVCGLCCSPEAWCSDREWAEEFVSVTRADAERLRRSERRELVGCSEAGRCADYMRMVYADPDAHAGRCAALEGAVGEAVRCRCYGRRPEACRRWERGGRGCLFVLWRSRMPTAARRGAGVWPGPATPWHESRPPLWLRWARRQAWFVAARATCARVWERNRGFCWKGLCRCRAFVGATYETKTKTKTKTMR